MNPLAPLTLPVDAADAGARNARLLTALRWVAVGGQLAAILLVDVAAGITLPAAPMLATVVVLALFNLVLTIAGALRPLSDAQMFATLLVDVACLTIQLHLSGGVGNPFITLYLLQVVIAAVLLPAWASWALVALTSACFAWLALWAPPFALPPGIASDLSPAYVGGSWFNYAIAAVLLVLVVTQIVRNQSRRDASLAAMRQRAAEEEHIVRMGLLASGAAHELGTPLSSIAVMLGDWRKERAVAASPTMRADLDDMIAEIARCKDILSQILLASGEVRGDAPARTTLRTFLGAIVGDWRAKTGEDAILEDRLDRDPRIVADRALAQTVTNLLDNAREAGARAIVLSVALADGALTVQVRDDGSGFEPAVLEGIGKPYVSTKLRRGAGLGLFLATNVLRTLGGTLGARNRAGGGSEVTLRLPLSSLAIGGEA